MIPAVITLVANEAHPVTAIALVAIIFVGALILGALFGDR